MGLANSSYQLYSPHFIKRKIVHTSMFCKKWDAFPYITSACWHTFYFCAPQTVHAFCPRLMSCFTDSQYTLLQQNGIPTRQITHRSLNVTQFAKYPLDVTASVRNVSPVLIRILVHYCRLDVCEVLEMQCSALLSCSCKCTY